MVSLAAAAREHDPRPANNPVGRPLGRAPYPPSRARAHLPSTGSMDCLRCGPSFDRLLRAVRLRM